MNDLDHLLGGFTLRQAHGRLVDYRMRSEGFPFIIWGFGGWTLVRLQLLVGSPTPPWKHSNPTLKTYQPHLGNAASHPTTASTPPYPSLTHLILTKPSKMFYSEAPTPTPGRDTQWRNRRICVSMYLCVYVSIDLCICVSMYLCIYLSEDLFLVYVSMYRCIYASMYLRMHLCIGVSLYLCIYGSMYLRIRVNHIHSII